MSAGARRRCPAWPGRPEVPDVFRARVIEARSRAALAPRSKLPARPSRPSLPSLAQPRPPVISAMFSIQKVQATAKQVRCPTHASFNLEWLLTVCWTLLLPPLPLACLQPGRTQRSDGSIDDCSLATALVGSCSLSVPSRRRRWRGSRLRLTPRAASRPTRPRRSRSVSWPSRARPRYRPQLVTDEWTLHRVIGIE